MNWMTNPPGWLVYLALAAFLYSMAGPILRSVNGTDKLTWRDRRWRRGVTAAVLIFGGGLDISTLKDEGFPLGVTAPLWILLGFLVLFVIRWWLRDWEREKQAREALVERLHEEKQELVLPQMSRGQKVWNWVLIIYGAAGLLGGLYEVVWHLLKK
jgi:hypothetical protein